MLPQRGDTTLGDELARIGARLPASSSALLTFAETTDPRSVLKAAAAHAPVTASAAGIGDDLAVHVFAGATDPIEVPSRPEGAAITPSQAAPTSMILLRYPDPGTAEQVVSRAAPAAKNTGARVQVELVIQADRERPVRRVEVDGFWMDDHPVTVAEFRRFVAKRRQQSVPG